MRKMKKTMANEINVELKRNERWRSQESSWLEKQDLLNTSRVCAKYFGSKPEG